MKTLKPGDRVGAGRWPNSYHHPDTWNQPHQGTLLALDDPRAWAGTLAFSSETPDAAAVRTHVAWCRSQGLLSDRQPVLWDFGRAYWENTASLRSCEDDWAAWLKARAAQCAAYSKPHLACAA